MSSNTRSRTDELASLRSRELPAEYLCIDEDQAVLVFDYLNGADDKVDHEMVAVHLGLCYRCQESVAALIRLDASVRDRLSRLKPVPA